MKTFENRFGANVELRNIGDHVVAAKVSTSLRLDRSDSAYVSGRILAELLPAWVDSHRLYDGSYVLVSSDETRYASNLCIPSDTCSLAEFDAAVELEDGLVHTVHFSLEQSDNVRRDYVVLDTRFILLRGKITVEIDDDEIVEE